MQTLYAVFATVDEDGLTEMSPRFTSRRKAGRYLYGAKHKLDCLAYLTRFYNDTCVHDMPNYRTPQSLSRSQRRKSPCGFVAAVSIAQQKEEQEWERQDRRAYSNDGNGYKSDGNGGYRENFYVC